MKDRLHDFLHSSNSSSYVKMIQNPLTDCYWGVDAFKHIPDTFDVRYFYMVYEYTKLMSERIHILKIPSLEEKMSQLASKFQTLLYSSMKLHIKPAEKYAESIAQKLYELLEEERALLYQFYNIL